jgi:hypothetical protein
VRRSAWTDERIGEKMGAIDSTFEMLRDELRGLRADNREGFAALRADITALQRHLVQIGFGLVGVLIGAMTALVAAILALA